MSGGGVTYSLWLACTVLAGPRSLCSEQAAEVPVARDRISCLAAQAVFPTRKRGAIVNSNAKLTRSDSNKSHSAALFPRAAHHRPDRTASRPWVSPGGTEYWESGLRIHISTNRVICSHGHSVHVGDWSPVAIAAYYMGKGGINQSPTTGIETTENSWQEDDEKLIPGAGDKLLLPSELLDKINQVQTVQFKVATVSLGEGGFLALNSEKESKTSSRFTVRITPAYFQKELARTRDRGKVLFVVRSRESWFELEV